MKSFGIILGSGLNLSEYEKNIVKIVKRESRGIHKKTIKECKINSDRLFIFEGRSHLYETSNFDEIYHNINFANENGVDLLIITNAAGALNSSYEVSDLMLISSHLNFIGKFLKSHYHPPNYDLKFLESTYNKLVSKSFKIQKGTYCALSGPVYETKSEISFYKKLGADAVGMSTIPELYLASKYKIKTLCVSFITNLLNFHSTEILQHENVLTAASLASKKIKRLLEIILEI